MSVLSCFYVDASSGLIVMNLRTGRGGKKGLGCGGGKGDTLRNLTIKFTNTITTRSPIPTPHIPPPTHPNSTAPFVQTKSNFLPVKSHMATSTAPIIDTPTHTFVYHLATLPLPSPLPPSDPLPLSHTHTNHDLQQHLTRTSIHTPTGRISVRRDGNYHLSYTQNLSSRAASWLFTRD